MSAIAIIPARYASTRFPGKPLAAATGRCLVQHVYERVLEAERIETCVVATDDARIADAVRGFGGEVEMTSDQHRSGTDRIAEVARRRGWADDRVILNVQGDEPEIDPAVLDQLVGRMLAEPDTPVGTLACPFPEDRALDDPNCVKVVRNQPGHALYFSRSVIPYGPEVDRTAGHPVWLLHLGVYAFRRSFLLEFAGWPPSWLESTERLEQLRILDRGYPIAVELAPLAAPGIDTPEEYEQFVARWRAAHA